MDNPKVVITDIVCKNSPENTYLKNKNHPIYENINNVKEAIFISINNIIIKIYKKSRAAHPSQL